MAFTIQKRLTFILFLFYLGCTSKDNEEVENKSQTDGTKEHVLIDNHVADSDCPPKALEILRIINEIGAKSFIEAEENPRRTIAGELEGTILMLQGKLWRYGYEANWDKYEKKFVLSKLDKKRGINAGLTILYCPQNQRPWTMIHPGIHPSEERFSNDELEATVKRLKITNWTAVYPDSISKYSEEVAWIDKVMKDNVKGFGKHYGYHFESCTAVITQEK